MKNKIFLSITLIIVILIAPLLLTQNVSAGKRTYTAIDLGTLGGPWSYAAGLNNRGQVVGLAKNEEWYYHAFLWYQGTMTDLGTLGGNDSSAQDINDSGQVVGFSKMSTDTPTTYMTVPFCGKRE